MKKCNSCGTNKPLSEFPKDNNLKTGYRGRCKSCNNYQCKKYYQKHQQHICSQRNKYAKSEEGKTKINHYFKQRRKFDIQFKIKDNLRRRINYAINHSVKSDSTTNLLGCSLTDFKNHIEKLWSKGMNWNNYGLHGWHIDHIKPCASFDLSDSKQQKICFHYTNLQPLWAKDNWSKGAK